MNFLVKAEVRPGNCRVGTLGVSSARKTSRRFFLSFVLLSLSLYPPLLPLPPLRTFRARSLSLAPSPPVPSSLSLPLSLPPHHISYLSLGTPVPPTCPPTRPPAIATLLTVRTPRPGRAPKPRLKHPPQVVVICGKNKAVKHELEDATWPLNTRVIVHGFVSNMDEWMGAVDALVTKAGPGTIAEATIRGLPVMLSGYLPGQEEGNVPYVVNGEMGFGGGTQKRLVRMPIHE